MHASKCSTLSLTCTVRFLSESTSPSVQVEFTPTSGNGTMKSFVYDMAGNLVEYLSIPVVVADNAVAEQANNLQEVACEPKPSDCKESYITSFSIGKLKNANSGCSPSGYGDFTASGKLDSLFMGESYDARISSTEATTTAYFGIWIDYNKNGNFEDAGEFIGSSLSADTAFKLPNLLLRNDPDFRGPKRLRIKMQTSGAITASESCQLTGGEGGEIEDYMIFLEQADRLKAPNIITPNNEGKNDLFIIRNINTKKSNRLIIVNRWGDIMYKKVDYENDWDGKDKNGNTLPRATYFFLFTNGPDTIQGFVEVLND